jgi:hypothetical protein
MWGEVYYSTDCQPHGKTFMTLVVTVEHLYHEFLNWCPVGKDTTLVLLKLMFYFTLFTVNKMYFIFL